MIPKIIHQTYKDDALPLEIRDGIDLLKKNNPDWIYKFYSDDDCFNFIKKNYSFEVLSAYQSINPKYGAARADFFRYLLIYHLGGVYLDIKSTAKRPLSEITKDESYLLSHWDNSVGGTHVGWGMHFSKLPNGEFQQWYLAAEPRHPFLLQVIKKVLQNIKNYTPESYGVGKEGVLKTTGPIAYTHAVLSCLPIASHRLVRNNHILGLAYSVYNANDKNLLLHVNSMPHQHYSKLDEPVVLIKNL